MKIAEYHDGMTEIIADSGNPDIFKISPSSVADFFTATSQYYHEQVLGEDKAFNGSTATYLGSIVHHCAEVQATPGESLDNIEQEVEDFLATITDPDVDKATILTLWYPMAQVLLDNAVDNPDREIVGTEDFLFRKLNNDVYVGGTYDQLSIDMSRMATKPKVIGYSINDDWLTSENLKLVNSILSQ